MLFFGLYRIFLSWDPYVASGLPYLSDILNQSFYPLHIIFFGIYKNILAYNLYILTHYALAGYFTYLFLKSLRLKGLAAFLGGLIFMFSGFMVGQKSHTLLITTAVWLPFVLYCIERYRQKRKIIFIILGALGFSFSILSGYPQIILYLTMVAFAYLLFRGLCEKLDLRFIVGGFLMLILGVLLSAVQLLPLFELVRFTTRERISYDFFVSFSFALKDLPLLVFPFFYGGTHAPGLYSKIYNGPWFLSELSGYMGIIPLSLAVMCSIMRWRSKRVLFWTFTAIAGFILVLGGSTPVYRFLYHVPIYNMFRAPSRNWLEVNFAVAVLAAFCVNYFLNNKGILQKQIKRCTIMVGFLLIIITTGILLSKDFGGNKISLLSANRGMFHNLVGNLRSGAAEVYVPLLIIIASLIFILFIPRFYSSKKYWFVMAVFIFIDLYSFGHFHQNNYPPKSEIYSEKNEVFRFLKKRESTMDDFRIWPVEINPKLLYPNTNKFYGIATIKAASPVWLKDYVELTNSLPPSGGMDRPIISLKNNYIISLLACKYVITTDEKIAKILESTKTVRTRKEASEGGLTGVISKKDASKWELGNAIFQEGRFILASPNEKSISYIRFPIKIKEKNQCYKIAFKVKSDLKEALIVQIYAKNYAPQSGWVWIEHKDVSNKKFTKIVRTLDSAGSPEDGFLRFFTVSRSPIEIKDIVLEEIPDNRILWNRGEDNKFYKKVYETRDNTKIFENLNYLPRVRFVKNVVPVGDFKEAVNLLKYDTGLNLKEDALVEGLPGGTFGKGKIFKIEFKNDRIDIRASTKGRAFLVLADTYFPGWKAYIDGKETKIYRTNGVTRGILIDREGKHDIIFEYSPKGFKIGLLISISIGAILIGGLFIRRFL